jgi:chromate transporter
MSETASRLKICLQLFFAFFKVSIFTLGGGLAMLPLIERKVVHKEKWIGQKEFLDMVSISNSLPGSLAVNFATPVGYKLAGHWGALSAALGAVLPPFLVIILVASAFLTAKDIPIVVTMFKGLRPCVVALIAIPIVTLSRTAGLDRKTIPIPVAVILLVVLLKIDPVYIVILSVLVNVARVLHQKRRKSA